MGASKPSRSRRCIINSGAVSKTDSVFHPIGLNDDQVRKNYRSTEPGRSRKNRVAQTDRPPDGATKPCPPTDQKARTCDKARFRERPNGSTMPNRTGQPWPKVSSEPVRPTRSCPFFARAQHPTAIKLSRHSGMDRRNPDCRDANNLCHPWSLGSGDPCRNDGFFLNLMAVAQRQS